MRKIKILTVTCILISITVCKKKSNSTISNIDVSENRLNGIDNSITLNDTPNPQRIEFDELYNGDIELTILDVYNGFLYSDTCINSIMQYMKIN